VPGRNPKLLAEIDQDNSRTRYTKAVIDARRAETPTIEKATLRAPEWLDDTARKEWRRIIRLTRDAGIYTDLDTNALGMYCMAFSRARLAYDEYKRLAEKVAETDPGKTVLVTSRGKMNPLLRIAIDAEEQCRKWAAILGLDPVGRARIGVQRAKRKDEFGETFDD
jgi:P27 family predicted phage terminase small subunit